MARQKKDTDARQTLLLKVIEAAREIASKDHGNQLDKFVPLYYEGASTADLRNHSVTELAGAALSHFQLAASLAEGESAVRVFNPRRRENGWGSAHTIIESVAPDMPFLVDSLTMAAQRNELIVHQTVHPVLGIKHGKSGRLLNLEKRGGLDGASNVSFVHLEVDRVTNSERLERLRADVEGALSDTSTAVTDWTSMRDRAEAIAYDMDPNKSPLNPEELEEARHFLHWLVDNHFTFLGYREYRLDTEDSKYVLHQISGTGLGILRNEHDEARSLTIPRELRARALAKEAIIVTKANSRSTVHRDAFLDYIGVKRFDEEGKVCGEYRFLGLFTSSVYANSPREIPIVRHKIRHALAHSHLPPVSHAGKGLVSALETLPRDELFQANNEELYEVATGIMQIQERQQVRLFIRRDAFGRFYSCLIYVPRERYNSSVREKMQSILGKALGGREIESYVHMGESRLARVHIIVHTAPWQRARIGHKRLERELAEASRTWNDRLHEVLIRRYGEERGTVLADYWDNGFPLSYQEDSTPEEALRDIRSLRRLKNAQSVDINLYRSKNSPEGELRLKVFCREQPMVLSDIMPLLENMGLKVIEERPYELHLHDDSIYWTHVFETILHGDTMLDIKEIAPYFREVFLSLWAGETENDRINSLVLSAGFNWRQLRIIRAYAKYLLQTGMPFGSAYVEEVIASRAEVTRALVELFELRFDPELDTDERKKQVHKTNEALNKALDTINGQDEDRILRGLATLVRVTLRTNHFCTDRRGHYRHYLSFKLDSERVPELPLPRPMFEIFVYAPHVQGVHLRGGKVARGGIRWSDRKADFRTEVLGLMKAQMVKNTVIVPVGSKGGFIVNNLPADGDRDEILTEVKRCYRDFMRGLLDLTDNISGTKIVPPDNMVRYDDDDPYLVVAADKGTATFSDLANEIAADYSYWLDDAFASGGSVGYDHKEMGITAKGAWESVKRLFREMNVNPETESVSAIGIGDMSGDVFGNGMLRSKQLRLIAAFNHQHIFIDPDPDPKTSYAERKRLYNLPRSAWSDYDTKKISKGGGIYERKAKTIKLSTQACKALGVEKEEATLTPQKLIQAILKAPVDLFWNGGIGTYVKFSRESNDEVGDRANDALRVNGRDLRCKVVGEGGNLGFTQRGRIEYALAGGHITTDFIDNSAGVDCSDHEVNIKILLNQVRRSKRLSEADRRKLLASMTEEVESLVLRDNYLQSLALSVAESQTAERLNEDAHLLRTLEREGHLNRQLEALPSEEEIAERRVSGRGLTRPELAVIFAYSKIAMFNTLDETELAEDPYLRRELVDYFPKLLREKYTEVMPAHRLQGEIIATAITNSMINRMGPNFPFRLQEETGTDINTAARAYTIVRESLDMLTVWRKLESLDARLASQTQTEIIAETYHLIRHGARWVIEHGYGQANISETVEVLGAAAQALLANLPAILPEYLGELYNKALTGYREKGLDDDLADRIAAIPALYAAFDIAEVSAQTKVEVAQVAKAYFLLGARLEFDWLHQQIEALPGDDHWKALARATLREGLYAQQSRLAIKALQRPKGSTDKVEDLVSAWLEKESTAVKHLLSVSGEIRALGQVEFSSISVILQKAYTLARRRKSVKSG
ncbi:MAG: NAD-glutamate dehydrogenase [Gammaproteobacteria bacterium]